MGTNLKLTAKPNTLEIVITCVINAPRDLVFDAFLDPILIPLWWGQDHMSTTVDVLESWPGGMWRYVQTDKKGNEYAFNGFFHAIFSPERIVQTFEYEGSPGHVLLETITFEDLKGKTRLTDQSVFQSVADRDAMLAADMETGSTTSIEALSRLLARQDAEVDLGNKTALPPLGAPAQRALAAVGITSLEELAKWREEKIARLHGIGPTTLRTLRHALKEIGSKFAR
jgi:uncharacterized protein YndB with AHSA1/START domain